MIIKRNLSQIVLDISDVKAKPGEKTPFLNLFDNALFCIELRPEEREAIYREVQAEYMRKDAFEKLAEHYNIDPYPDTDMEQSEELQHFQSKMGCSFWDAINAKSENYLLDELIQLYWDNQDNSLAASAIWEMAIEKLAEVRK